MPLRALGQGAGPRVIIDSSPPGATVYVDGKERGVQGYSGSVFKIRLSKGPHRVLLELEGYKPVEQVINVTQAQKFTFTLERAPARLEVKSPGTNETARGGEVFVDGAPAGTVPVPVEVPSGRHLIEVRKPGYRVYSETIELRAGDARTLWVTLQSEVKAGSLLVAAEGNAEVYVDGQPRGPAPVLVDNLPEGEHLVEVRRTEPGSTPWRQNVRVIAGQQVKVLAHGQSAAPTGSLLVVSSVPDADVVVDGSTKGKANQEITGLRPGQHVVDLRAKGYAAVTGKVVEIETGKQRVERIEPPQSAEGRGIGLLRVIMVNPVEGAQYYINGRHYDETAILSERGVEVASGRNIVVVRKEGYGESRVERDVRPGAVETVNIDLRNVGRIFITSDPRGATVLIDKAVVGQSPYTAEEVPAGPHMVELTLPDHQTYVEQVVVQGGQQKNVNAVMFKPPVGVSPEVHRQGLSSFSALTVDPGNFTADFGAGFPYFLDGRLTVGVAKIKNFGLDAGVELRTTFYETDINANIRVQLIKVNPIAFGFNLLIGGGGGPRHRNGFVFEAGLPITLLAKNIVKLTVRPYLQIYSDRLCPSFTDLQDLVVKKDQQSIDNLLQPEHVGDRCSGGSTDDPAGPWSYNVIAAGLGYHPDANSPTGFSGGPMVLDAKALQDLQNNVKFHDEGTGTFLLDRFFGVRFFLQAVLEISISNSANLWVLIEGAPFQPERQAYKDKYNRVFPINDFPLYGRAGFTIKF